MKVSSRPRFCWGCVGDELIDEWHAHVPGLTAQHRVPLVSTLAGPICGRELEPEMLHSVSLARRCPPGTGLGAAASSKTNILQPGPPS
jgi:hypothetical protein